MTRLNTALSKLEKRAREVILCDWCKYTQPNALPATPIVNSPSALSVVCRWCGAVSTFGLKGLDEYEREAFRLCADQSEGVIYRNVRVYAATEWYHCTVSVKRWGVGAEELKENFRAFMEEKRKPESTEKLKGKALAKAEMKEKAHAFLNRMLDEEKKRYSPFAFSLPDEINRLGKEIAGVKDEWAGHQRVAVEEAEKWLRYELYLCRTSELCERALWGKTLPQTRLAIGNLSALVSRMEQKRREKIKNLTEKFERREQEWKAEQERRRIEREQRAAVPVVTPVEPFPAEPKFSPIEPLMPAEEAGHDFYDFLTDDDLNGRDFKALVNSFRFATLDERDKWHRLALAAHDAPSDAAIILSLFARDTYSVEALALLSRYQNGRMLQ